MDNAVRVILALGRGTNLAKFDIQSVHRIITVYPLDRHLLRMVWNGQLGQGFPPNLHVPPACNTSCRVCMHKGWNRRECPTFLPNLHCLDSGRDGTMDIIEGPKIKVCYQIHINVIYPQVLNLYENQRCTSESMMSAL